MLSGMLDDDDQSPSTTAPVNPAPELQLDVESLRTLLAVLDHGGPTRAAEHLGLSQSAVSWKIKRLEAKVGESLLIRDGHTLVPTRAGRALLEDARAIVTLHDRAVGRLTASELKGTVHLGSNEEVAASNMAALLGRFSRTHPDVQIEFHVGNSRDLSDRVDRGDLDVAVIQVDDGALRSTDRVLWTDELRWITYIDCPFDEGDVPLITFGRRCVYRPLSEPLLAAAGIDHHIAFSGPSSIGVHAAVAAGLGVAVLSSRFLGHDNVVEWPRADEVGPLPDVHQVARGVPGETSVLMDALMEAIEAELREPVFGHGVPLPNPVISSAV